LISGIREHPFSRRNVITTWNAADMNCPDCPITNCHGTVIQAFVDSWKQLHLVTYQRSADAVVGVPHNWFQYWAFLVWLASLTGKGVGSLTWVGGDVHLYDVHEALAREMLARKGEVNYTEVDLVYRPTDAAFRADDFSLASPYNPVLNVSAEMVV
jgi:thymidylate synthase